MQISGALLIRMAIVALDPQAAPGLIQDILANLWVAGMTG